MKLSYSSQCSRACYTGIASFALYPYISFFFVLSSDNVVLVAAHIYSI